MVSGNQSPPARILLYKMGNQEKLSRRTLLAAFSLLPAGRWLRAQQNPTGQPNPNFSTDVKVVNLLATVRDKQGQIVKDLTRDDFVVSEDGHPQTIRYFSRESDLPLTLGLLIDTSGSQRNVLEAERRASYRFLEQVLREDKDQAFVIHFDFEVELLQDLTSSRQKLEKALTELQVGQGRRSNNAGQYPGGGYPGGGYPGSRRSGRGGGGGRGGRGGTDLYDAVYLASDELMRKQHGRKAVIILSDGVDTGSKLSLEEGVESAQRADTLAYSILFSDDEAYGFGSGRWGGMGNRPDGTKVLQQISKQTGGRFFEVTKKQPIDKVFAALEEDLRNQYSIGYTPDRTDAAGGYRHIQVTTKQKGLIVQARDGYYAS